MQSLLTGKMQEKSFPHTKLMTLTKMLTEQDFQMLKTWENLRATSTLTRREKVDIAS